MIGMLRLAFSRAKKPAHEERPTLMPVGTHPLLDLYAMVTHLVDGQAALWRVMVWQARLWTYLAILWALLGMLYAWPSWGKLTGWW